MVFLGRCFSLCAFGRSAHAFQGLPLGSIKAVWHAPGTNEWHLQPGAAGFMVTVTLLASSAGGILFGQIADRIGRKKALMVTVLVIVYSWKTARSDS